jgi:transposase
MQLVEETCDITLTELRAKLIAEGHTFGIGTLWRFFRRRGVTWKKRPAMPANRIARTF